MLKKFGALTMMLVGSVVFLQPTAANAQSQYDRGGYYYSYDNRGDRDRYNGRRDFERREWREREEREARRQAWREREWRKHERWENRNYYAPGYGNGYGNNPYYGYPY